MQRIDIPVRSPTGMAWILAVMPFIVGGELLWEALKVETATLFRIPFTDGELSVAMALCAVVCVVGVVWLIALHVRPGRLAIDAEAGTLRRERRETWKRQVVVAPLADWHIRLQFYSESQRDQGAFRRLELKGPGVHEVLLLADVPDGKALCDTLTGLSDRLGGFHVELKRQPGA